MPEHVLVPFDGSPLSKRALEYACSEFPRSTITTLYVVDQQTDETASKGWSTDRSVARTANDIPPDGPRKGGPEFDTAETEVKIRRLADRVARLEDEVATVARSVDAIRRSQRARVR